MNYNFMKNNNSEIINELIAEIGKSYGLTAPPEGHCKEYKATEAKNCHDCSYNKFCLASALSKLSMLAASSKNNLNFNIIDEISSNMLLVSSDMMPYIDENFVDKEFIDEGFCGE